MLRRYLEELRLLWNIKERINRNVPELIEASAILNTGHILTSIKSMTYLNLNLSIKLPNAPEIIRIRPESKVRLYKNFPFLTALKISIDIHITAIRDIVIKINVLFFKSPNAAPVLVTKVIWRMFLTTGIDSPTERCL